MQVFDAGGVWLPRFDLWLDPHHARPLAVVTHGHADHMKRHAVALTTPATADIMRARGARSTRFETLDFARLDCADSFESDSFEHRGALVRFYPAGHVLGSAQVLVESPEGERLLYSGDFKLAPSLSCEATVVPRADTVVMETTFGLPCYAFEPGARVLEAIRQWCVAAIEHGELPVLFCYSLGKGQEVLAGLRDAGIPVALHARHRDICEVYARHGVDLGVYCGHERAIEHRGVLLCASGCRRGRWWRELEAARRVRTAYISGWAQHSAPERFGTDAAFALSDHADHAGLLEYVARTGARRVWTTHGFCAEFAADLRALGLEAAPLPRIQAPPLAPAPGRRTSTPNASNQQLCLAL